MKKKLLKIILIYLLNKRSQHLKNYKIANPHYKNQNKSKKLQRTFNQRTRKNKRNLFKTKNS